MLFSRKQVAILLMVGYALFMVICDSIAKELSSMYQVIAIVWYRYFFHAISFSIMSFSKYLITGEPEKIGRHSTQLLRGCILVFSTVLFFESIALMPLAEAMALLYVFPVVAVILSVIFLKERLSLSQMALILSAFVGVVLVLNPGVSTDLRSGLFAICAGILMGVFLFMTKVMSKDSTPCISSVYTGLIGIVLIPVFPQFEWVIFDFNSLVLGAMMGTAAAIGHFLMFLSMRYAPASVVSPFAFSEILFATAAGYLWFKDSLSGPTIFGICLLIITGVTFVMNANTTSDHGKWP